MNGSATMLTGPLGSTIHVLRADAGDDRQGGGGRLRAPGRRSASGNRSGIALHRVLDVAVAILLEALLQGLDRLADGGEVEEHHHVAAAVEI